MVNFKKSAKFLVLILLVSCGSHSSQDDRPEIPDEPEVAPNAEIKDSEGNETTPKQVEETVETPVAEEKKQPSGLELAPELPTETVTTENSFVPFEGLLTALSGQWHRCELRAGGRYFGIKLTFDIDALLVSETWSFDYIDESCSKISEDVAVEDGPRETSWDFNIALDEAIEEGIYPYDQEWVTDSSTTVHSALSIKDGVLYLAHPGVNNNPDGMSAEARATKIDWSKPHYKK